MTWFVKGSKHEGKSPSNHLSLTGIYAIPQSLGFSSLEKPCIKVKKREQKSKRKKKLVLTTKGGSTTDQKLTVNDIHA